MRVLRSLAAGLVGQVLAVALIIWLFSGAPYGEVAIPLAGVVAVLLAVRFFRLFSEFLEIRYRKDGARG